MSLLLEDIKTYLASFSLTTALRLALARLALRLLDSRAAVSYSQFGEDRVLPLFIKSERRGFYVDVGANDPIAASNTFWLYKKGWRGIVIDPNPELIRMHKRIRPRDVQIVNLVSNCGDPLEFAIFKNHRFSSASSAHVREWSSKERVIATITLRPRTLTEILDEQCCPETFDLLAIDVEGHDLQVLQSLDWKRYRPRMVVVEMPISNLLSPQGMRGFAHHLFLTEVHYSRSLDPMRAIFAEHGLRLVQVNQRPLPVLGRKRRQETNCWLVSELGAWA